MTTNAPANPNKALWETRRTTNLSELADRIHATFLRVNVAV
jgi:hypothetical protein